MLQTEIDDMNKILSLNKEEGLILNEIKDSKIKLIKDASISQTRNEILQDLNILKSEESFVEEAGREILESLYKHSNSTSVNNSVRAEQDHQNENEEEEEEEEEEYDSYIELENQAKSNRENKLTAVKTNSIAI